mmetsp:Transcript_18106/g.31036  ORF Transcript_18106/g.31036 Transcript_18106/m.31036 type:complete len:120 (-) Transcript_18106:860-1219(-)
MRRSCARSRSSSQQRRMPKQQRQHAVSFHVVQATVGIGQRKLKKSVSSLEWQPLAGSWQRGVGANKYGKFQYDWLPGLAIMLSYSEDSRLPTLTVCLSPRAVLGVHMTRACSALVPGVR